MTAAGLQAPQPRAAASRPRQFLDLAGLRLLRLHRASRRVPGALAALGVCGLVLRAALYWHWSLGSGNGAQLLPVVIEAGAASVIAVTAQSPFGDPERAGRRDWRGAGLGGAYGLHDRRPVRADRGWTTPWLWPARPPHDLGGALCAGLVFAAGIVAATVLGARAPREI